MFNLLMQISTFFIRNSINLLMEIHILSFKVINVVVHHFYILVIFQLRFIEFLPQFNYFVMLLFFEFLYFLVLLSSNILNLSDHIIFKRIIRDTCLVKLLYWCHFVLQTWQNVDKVIGKVSVCISWLWNFMTWGLFANKTDSHVWKGALQFLYLLSQDLIFIFKVDSVLSLLFKLIFQFICSHSLCFFPEILKLLIFLKLSLDVLFFTNNCSNFIFLLQNKIVLIFDDPFFAFDLCFEVSIFSFHFVDFSCKNSPGSR